MIEERINADVLGVMRGAPAQSVQYETLRAVVVRGGALVNIGAAILVIIRAA
jgi:hypothetical protein